MARTYPFAPLEAEYAQRFAAMVLAPARLAAIDATARKIIAGKARYRAVEELAGVPWAFIGVLHSRESGCDFRGVLHNGEKILGTGRKTKLVPAGRGPFARWEEAACDALAIKGYRPGTPDWSIARCLYEGERFNGFGYRMRGVPSAYLWSGSDQYVRGKYVADGVWSATAVDQQMGIAPLMRRLMELDDEVSFGGAGDALPLSPAAPAPLMIDAGDGLDPGEIRALQQRLRDLGYAEVGKADGLWGPRTTAGVAAFQATAGLPVSGALDTATAAALATAGPRPVAPERATVTAAVLKAEGDTVVSATSAIQTIAATVAAPTAIIGVLDQLGAASDRLALLRALLGEVPGPVWAALVLAVAGALYLVARQAQAAKVEAVRTGRDAGPA